MAVKVSNEPWRDYGDEHQPAGRTVTLTLPVPDGAIAGNNRGHWATTHRARTDAKNNAYYLAINDGHKDLHLAPVSITIDWHGWNKPDYDNAIARLKPAIDGLVLAGVIPDDSPEHVRQIAVRTIAIDRKSPRVTLTIQELV